MAQAKPDSYETEYMGGGEALLRDRRGMANWSSGACTRARQGAKNAFQV